MAAVTSQWPVLQLAEFVAVLTAARDEASALRAAVERAAEAVDAECASLLSGDLDLVEAVGYGSSEPPLDELRSVATGVATWHHVPGCGPCPVLVVPLDPELGGVLVLARSGSTFTGEEQALLRGMGRVLSLVVRVLRLYESEASARAQTTALLGDLEKRRLLLEHLHEIQRAIVTRIPTDEVLDRVARHTRELLGDEHAVGIRLVVEDDPDVADLVAVTGADPAMFELRRSLDRGVSGRAIREDRLVVVDDYGHHEAGDGRLVDSGLRAAVAAPVHREGAVVGALVVSTREAGRTYSEDEQAALRLLAEHVSLALNDAAAVETMRSALDDALHQATHDQLTGLPNRTLVLDRLSAALARTQRTGHPATVFFVDLDRFKLVNDFLGHSHGDRVLVMVGERLRRSVRPTDTVGRIAGDEFVVLSENLSLADAEAVAVRMADSVARPLEIDGRETLVTASIGIARTSSRAEAESLLGDADMALYRAKERGRSRVEHYDEELRTRMAHRIRTEQELGAALSRAELAIHYQPTVWSPTGEVVAMEALVRWKHPRRGLVPPSEFIAIAEDTGLVVPLGAWVLERACHDAVSWQRQSPQHRGVSVAVNLSPRQLADPGVVDTVVTTLRRTGLAPDHLWLELTENVLMEDPDDAIRTLGALRAEGVRFAIDDFGTGYSSLSNLRRFPVDSLKIDQSFIEGVGGSSEDDAIIRAILRMSEELGLTPVAEGVERPDQADALADLGCHLCQGFHFGRPAPLADALAAVSGPGVRQGLASVSRLAARRPPA